MAIKVTLNIDGVADAMGTAAYGTAAKAIIQTGTAISGPFATAGTVFLVSGQTQYDWWDTSGTASWYQFRLEGSPANPSAWSDPFQASSLSAYATIDDLLERLNLPDETRYNLLADLLVAISDQFDVECGRRFYRIPQVSGTTTRTYDGTGTGALRLPEGCVSLTTVEVASQTGGSFTTLGTAEWRLRPAHPEPDWPYTELVLTDLATVGTFATGYDTVRLTGVFGWETVPSLVTEAVLQLASRSYHQSQTADSGVIGLPDMGTVTMPQQRPDAWYRAIRAFGRRPGLAT